MIDNNEVIRLASRRDNERINDIESRLDEMRIQLDRIEKMIDDHCNTKDDDCDKCKKEIEEKIIGVLDAANKNLVRVVVALLKNGV